MEEFKGENSAIPKRLRGAIFLALVGFCAGLLLQHESAAPEDIVHFIPLDPIPSQVFPALIIGTVLGVIFFLFPPRNRQVVICNRCRTAKYKNVQANCSCGGCFENVEKSKYQNDKTKSE